MSMCGIYMIRCLANGKVYVGSSVNAMARWYTHRDKLRKNRHANKHLQYAWNKYGEKAFLFSFVLAVERDNEKLWEAEQREIAICRAVDRQFGFNIRIDVRTNIGVPMSPEGKAKISATNKGIKRGPMSLEARAKLSAAKTGRKRGPQSPEHIEKRIAPLRGRQSPIRGRKQTDEHVANRFAAMRINGRTRSA